MVELSWTCYDNEYFIGAEPHKVRKSPNSTHLRIGYLNHKIRPLKNSHANGSRPKNPLWVSGIGFHLLAGLYVLGYVVGQPAKPAQFALLVERTPSREPNPAQPVVLRANRAVGNIIRPP